MRTTVLFAAAMAFGAISILVARRVDNHGVARAAEKKTHEVAGPVAKVAEEPDGNRMTLEMAWKRFCDAFPDKKLDKEIKVAPRSAERFAGFVEGFTGAKLPRWWEEAVFGAEGYAKNWIYFNRPKSWPYDKPEEKDERETKQRYTLQRGVKCAKKGDWSVLQNKKTVVRIPKKALESGGDYISLSIQGETCFVAVHSDWSFGYRLFCVNRSTSKILWESTIRTDDGGLRGSTGSSWHCAEIIPQDKRVIVFGAAFDALYVVGLDSGNGKQLFRFTSWSR
jgi:hypothetical protein